MFSALYHQTKGHFKYCTWKKSYLANKLFIEFKTKHLPLLHLTPKSTSRYNLIQFWLHAFQDNNFQTDNLHPLSSPWIQTTLPSTGLMLLLSQNFDTLLLRVLLAPSFFASSIAHCNSKDYISPPIISSSSSRRKWRNTVSHTVPGNLQPTDSKNPSL
jgi:hypothetical protein